MSLIADSKATANTRPPCRSEASSLLAPKMTANTPSIREMNQPAKWLPSGLPERREKVVMMALSWSPRYGGMPMTATNVTKAESERDLPYRDAMKSEIVVILFCFARRTIFLRTIHQRAEI